MEFSQPMDIPCIQGASSAFSINIEGGGASEGVFREDFSFSTEYGASSGNSLLSQSSNTNSFHSYVEKPSISYPINYIDISTQEYQSEPYTASDMLIQPYEYPAKYRGNHYDICLLYSRQDKENAVAFREFLQKHVRLHTNAVTSRQPDICTFDGEGGIPQSMNKIEDLETAIGKSSLVFLYVTKEFCNCSWATFQKNECLMESINNPQKRESIIPINTQPDSESSHKMPFGLRSLQPLDISRLLNGKDRNITIDSMSAADINKIDKYFINKITKLLEATLPRRQYREKEYAKNRQKWVVGENHKRHLLSIKEQKEKEQKNCQRQQELKDAQKGIFPPNLSKPVSNHNLPPSCGVYNHTVHINLSKPPLAVQLGDNNTVQMNDMAETVQQVMKPDDEPKPPRVIHPQKYSPLSKKSDDEFSNVESRMAHFQGSAFRQMTPRPVTIDDGAEDCYSQHSKDTSIITESILEYTSNGGQNVVGGNSRVEMGNTSPLSDTKPNPPVAPLPSSIPATSEDIQNKFDCPDSQAGSTINDLTPEYNTVELENRPDLSEAQIPMSEEKLPAAAVIQNCRRPEEISTDENDHLSWSESPLAVTEQCISREEQSSQHMAGLSDAVSRGQPLDKSGNVSSSELEFRKDSEGPEKVNQNMGENLINMMRTVAYKPSEMQQPCHSAQPSTRLTSLTINSESGIQAQSVKEQFSDVTQVAETSGSEACRMTTLSTIDEESMQCDSTLSVNKLTLPKTQPPTETLHSVFPEQETEQLFSPPQEESESTVFSSYEISSDLLTQECNSDQNPAVNSDSARSAVKSSNSGEHIYNKPPTGTSTYCPCPKVKVVCSQQGIDHSVASVEFDFDSSASYMDEPVSSSDMTNTSTSAVFGTSDEILSNMVHCGTPNNATAEAKQDRDCDSAVKTRNGAYIYWPELDISRGLVQLMYQYMQSKFVK